MTVNRGPGVAPIAGVGTTTVQHRLQLAGLYAENAPGVPRSGVLAQATDLLVVAKADMSYDVLPAPLVISRTAAEGVYTPTLTGTTNVATDAAPVTNSRWDLIYVKQNDQAKGDADNAAVIGVEKGGAAASPTKPTGSLPAGAYVIAEARIFAGTTGTNGGSNTIAQVWRHTAARGAPITIRNATERAEITAPAQGQIIDRRDLGSQERWNGMSWATTGTLPYSDTNLYSAYDANYGAPSYTKDIDGRVHLSGLLGTPQSSITMTGLTSYTLATLPAGFRPAKNCMFTPPTSVPMGGKGTLYVRADGRVLFENSVTFSGVSKANFYIGLDGFNWTAAS